MKIVGTHLTDKVFLELAWEPATHQGHFSPSRKRIVMSTQSELRVPRNPEGRPNSPLEGFVAGKINPTTKDTWSSVFPEFPYSVASGNFGLSQPPQPYTLKDFATFEDDSNGGRCSPQD